MRILTVYSQSKGGGCFKRLKMAITALSDSGHEVYYISPKDYGLNGKNIKCIETGNFSSGVFHNICFLIYSSIITLYIQRKYEIERFFAFESFSVLPLILSSKLRQINIQTFLRGIWLDDLLRRKRPKFLIYISKIVESLCLNNSHKIIANSASLATYHSEKYGLKSIEILTNGFNLNNYNYNRKSFIDTSLRNNLGISDNKFLISYIGTFKRRKNVSNLIEAVNLLPTKLKKDIFLLIIGSGNDYEKVVQSIKKSSSVKSKLLTWQSNVKPFVVVSDLIVLPSDFEGSPNILIESILLQTPCIGTNAVGIQDVLHYDELLFKDTDPGTISSFLENIISNDYNKIQRLCESRREVFNFDWDQKIADTITNGN